MDWLLLVTTRLDDDRPRFLIFFALFERSLPSFILLLQSFVSFRKHLLRNATTCEKETFLSREREREEEREICRDYLPDPDLDLGVRLIRGRFFRGLGEGKKKRRKKRSPVTLSSPKLFYAAPSRHLLVPQETFQSCITVWNYIIPSSGVRKEKLFHFFFLYRLHAWKFSNLRTLGASELECVLKLRVFSLDEKFAPLPSDSSFFVRVFDDPEEKKKGKNIRRTIYALREHAHEREIARRCIYNINYEGIIYSIWSTIVRDRLL